jgi:uroporphyrinogen III methyltransferase/synthase
MKNGKVYLIGAGPGDPGLIAVRGADILKEADVVIYDYLVDKRMLRYAADAAELIICGRSPELRQQRITQLLVRKAKAGKKVVRLKGGDPFLFSRCSHELEALVKNGIEFEVVPGITAASAASAFSGIPLTESSRASSVCFVTGKEALSKKKSLIDWDALSKNATIVFYMGVARLNVISQKLINCGRKKNTPVAIIQDASLLTQKIVVGTLGDIAIRAKERGVKAPAIIIVGDVVRFGKRFNWFDKNKHILFTGLSREKFFTPGKYEHVPLIKIKFAPDYTRFDRLLKGIAGFDWVVFTSGFGVEYFFKRLADVGLDSRSLAGVSIAVIGRSTRQKLLVYALKPDLVSPIETSEGLISEFKRIKLKGKKIFLPQSLLSSKKLQEGLKKLGAKVETAVAYKNVIPDDLPELDLELFDEIVFTSPSTVKNFKKKYKRIPGYARIRCIGKVTAREVERCRLSD